MTTVTVTNESGVALEQMDILKAHTGEGRLHKAFSVYVFRGKSDEWELLIQKRSAEKMLWPGHWANTCCSHPREGEDIVVAGERRLQEECGFTCPLSEHSAFVYRAEDPEGRGVEHEHDTLLIGEVEEAITLTPDSREIAELKWITLETLLRDMGEQPALYTPWFHEGLQILLRSFAKST